MSSDALTSWFAHWADAAALQIGRVIGAPSHRRGMTEAMLFVTAARDALRSAEKVLGRKHPAVRRMVSLAPGLKDTRDILAHHDSYALGKGWIQQTCVEGCKREEKYCAHEKPYAGSVLLLSYGWDKGDVELELTLLPQAADLLVAHNVKQYGVSMASVVTGLIAVAEAVAFESGLDAAEVPLIQELRRSVTDDGRLATRSSA